MSKFIERYWTAIFYGGILVITLGLICLTSCTTLPPEQQYKQIERYQICEYVWHNRWECWTYE